MSLAQPIPDIPVSQPGERLFANAGRGLVKLMTGAGILVIFAISPMVLYQYGLNYEAPGGSFIEKVHPGSWLLSGAFICAMLGSGNPLRYLDNIVARQPGTLVFLLSWTILMVQIIAVQRMPFTPVIDTFLMPMVLVVVVRTLGEGYKARLAGALHLVFCANAVLALYEYLTGNRLTPYVAGTLAILDDWRSTALFGHPLGNAILTGSYIVALCVGAARDIAKPLRPLQLGLQLAAMVAFGGRSSLVLVLVFMAIAALGRLSGFLQGRRISLPGVALAMMGIPLLLYALFTLASGGFFDQLLLRFVDDNGSAKARLVMLHLFELIPLREIIVGPDPALLSSLLRQEGSEYGLESFWLATILSYGLIASLIFFAGLLAFCLDLVRASRPQAAWVLLFFFLIASTSVSLSAKTVVFGMLVCMILLMLRPAHKVSTLVGYGGRPAAAAQPGT